VKVRWGFGVAVLALALACGRAYGQTPTPDPAPVPAPAVQPPERSEPVLEEPAPQPPPAPKTKKREAPARPLAVRMARLHPPLVENTPYANARSMPAVAIRIVESPFARPSYPGFSSVLTVVLLLVGMGTVTAVIVVFGPVPQKLLRGFPLLIVDHRGHLAFGSFAALLGVAIGVLIPVLLR
jgi:hypothetical protein